MRQLSSRVLLLLGTRHLYRITSGDPAACEPPVREIADHDRTAGKDFDKSGIYWELPGPSLLTRHPTGVVRALHRAGHETIARRIAGWLGRRAPHADCLYCGRSG